MSANLDYQMMLFLHDQSVPDLASLTSLPTEDRELVSAVMDGLSNFRNTLRSDNNMLYSRKIRPLTDLADRLKQQAELSIPTLVLCTCGVDGFGRYDPIEPARLLRKNRSRRSFIASWKISRRIRTTIDSGRRMSRRRPSFTPTTACKCGPTRRRRSRTNRVTVATISSCGML